MTLWTTIAPASEDAVGAIIFDLDDTLYLERDFALSGFVAVGSWLEAEAGIGGFGDLCRELFMKGERARIFDRALALLGRESKPELVRRLVEVYRGHAPDIRLAPDAARWLGRSPLPAGLITDGPAAMQRAKVRALGLEGRLEPAIFTGDWADGFGKPHPRGFVEAERRVQTARIAGRLVYVADNPAKDFVRPRSRGWLTVQVTRAERQHHAPPRSQDFAAHAAIPDLDALDACLERLIDHPALQRAVSARAGA